MTPPKRRFVTVKAAASELGVSTGSVYTWLRATEDTGEVARQTLRLPSGNRMIPKLVVDVVALDQYQARITTGRPRK